jgi:hypothetical protein
VLELEVVKRALISPKEARVVENEDQNSLLSGNRTSSPHLWHI